MKPEDTLRSIRFGRAPSSHEWTEWQPGLWRCPWCDGFASSIGKPDPEAIARDLDACRAAVAAAEGETKS